MRGIDFYSTWGLIWVFSHAFYRYWKKFDHLPSVTCPTTFNDKVLWFKFFGEVPVPQAGDKLATGLFIPPDLRGQLTSLPLVWESENPELPDNATISPGIYYLKANLGSNMFTRIEYPLTKAKRVELEARTRRWLRARPGLDRGEWWYNTFKPKIFLERSVTGDQDSISWNFYVLNGDIPMIGLFKKHLDGTNSSTWLDTHFQHLPTQSVLPSVGDFVVKDQHLHMLEMARKIGSVFNSVRVDFLEGQDGHIYLCELTFAPGDGLSKRPPEVDALLSAPWKTLR